MISDASIGARKFRRLNFSCQVAYAPYGIGCLPMALTERIQKIITDSRGKIRAVTIARFAGCSKGLVSQWLSGVTGTAKSMNYRHASGIHDNTGYRVEWLIKGELPEKDEDWPGSSGWGKLDSEERRHWMMLLGRLTRKQRRAIEADVHALIAVNNEVLTELGPQAIDAIDSEIDNTFASVPIARGRNSGISYAGPIGVDTRDSGRSTTATESPKEKAKPAQRRPKK